MECPKLTPSPLLAVVFRNYLLSLKNTIQVQLSNPLPVRSTLPATPISTSFMIQEEFATDFPLLLQRLQ